MEIAISGFVAGGADSDAAVIVKRHAIVLLKGRMAMVLRCTDQAGSLSWFRCAFISTACSHGGHCRQRGHAGHSCDGT